MNREPTMRPVDYAGVLIVGLALFIFIRPEPFVRLVLYVIGHEQP